jgi:hypothetical protein
MKSKNLIEQPDAIIVTLPKRFFEEYDHAKYLDEIRRMSEDEGFMWFRAVKNLPKVDVLYVYTIIDNKIHHRANLVHYERNKTYTFPRPEGGRRTFENKNWIVTTGPVVMAPHEWPMKGFQGFRYSKTLF